MIEARARGRFNPRMSEPPSESRFPQPDWVEHLQTAILLLDAEDRVRFLNPAAEDLLGVTASHAGVALSRELRASGLGELVARASREQRALSAQDIEWQDAGRVQWLFASFWATDTYVAGARPPFAAEAASLRR